MKIRLPIIIALIFAAAHGATFAQRAGSGNAQPHSCPASIMAGGDRFDLAGAIKQAGSSKALLAAFEQGMREMSGDCSSYANADYCRQTKTFTTDVIVALKRCISIDASVEQVAANNSQQQNSQITTESITTEPEENPFSSSAISNRNIDTATDYSGRECKWLVVKDEESCKSRVCRYQEGETIAIGSRAYRCEGGLWAKVRDCTQAPLPQQRSACERDIPRIYGRPGEKEISARKVYLPEN